MKVNTPTADELYGRYHERVFTYAKYILHDYDLAQDVVQATFEKALLSLHTLRNGDSLESWLLAIARHETFNLLRHSRGRMGMDPEALTEETTPLEESITSEATEIILRTIEDLKPEYREVLVLREYDQLSYAEIASIVGVSQDVIRMRLLRARRALVKRIRPYYQEVKRDDM